MGIEPTRSAWKADVLPLNYARRVPAKSPVAADRLRAEAPLSRGDKPMSHGEAPWVSPAKRRVVACPTGVAPNGADA